MQPTYTERLINWGVEAAVTSLPYPDKIPGIKHLPSVKALKKTDAAQKRQIRVLKHLVKDLEKQQLNGSDKPTNNSIKAKLYKKAESALDHHTYQRGQQAWDQVGKLAAPLGMIVPGAAISVTVLSETKKVRNLEKYIENMSLLNPARKEKMLSLGKALLISAALRLASPYFPSVETTAIVAGSILGAAIVADAASLSKQFKEITVNH
jgi:hypothetical protein